MSKRTLGSIIAAIMGAGAVVWLGLFTIGLANLLQFHGGYIVGAVGGITSVYLESRKTVRGFVYILVSIAIIVLAEPLGLMNRVNSNVSVLTYMFIVTIAIAIPNRWLRLPWHHP